MPKKSCDHGRILPRGLRCDRGYLVIRLKTPHGNYHLGCGAHTKDAERIAKDKLSEIRRSQRLKEFELPSKAKSIKFSQASEIFQRRHFVEYKDPHTRKPRSQVSISTNQSHLNILNTFFKDYDFDAITFRDLQKYKQKRIEYDEVANGTFNKEMSIMSSMFTMFEKWVEAQEIDPIRLPVKNPCKLMEDLHEEPRQRVASLDELRRLKQACIKLNDLSLWTVIETELCTSLRLNDLMALENTEAVNGQISLKQGKTGLPIHFPASVRPVKWQNMFVNFRTRFERARKEAGLVDLQFRDLRKTGLQILEGKFTVEDLARKAGHADPKITKKWYLRGPTGKDMVPMLDAARKILDSL